MKTELKSYSRFLTWAMALLLSALAVGCGGGGRDPILGIGSIAVLAPTVTAVAPVNNATGVPVNSTIITALFSEPMAPITGAASFTITCASPCANATGTVALDSTNRIATFTSAADLAPLTLYTGTITGAKSLATGLALATPYIWHFTTGLAPDTTKPSVTLTAPATTNPGPTLSVPANTTITAIFSEDMAPATITATSFTVTCTSPCVSPAGTVSYVVGSRTAVFTPAAVLAANTTYTGTITTAATDLAGNQLAGNQAPLPAASNYVWTFTTSAAVQPKVVSVLSTNPSVDGTINNCSIQGINATFAVASGFRMDPLSVNTATFTMTGPEPALTPVTAASVVLDASTGTTATFTPLNSLNAGSYLATIKGGANGVSDLAIPPNYMANDFTWNFTVQTCPPPPPPPPVSILGTASTFGTFGGSAGMTNQGIKTTISADIGTIATGTSTVTGFHDTAGDIYTETGSNIGAVNGTIYTCTTSTTGPTSASVNASNCAIATQARLDAQAAYATLVAMPSTATVSGNLGGQTLAPGVYTSSSTLAITGNDLTLDAHGNANAVFVFQVASALTVGDTAPRSIILTGSAQAKNVFWTTGSGAVINYAGGGTMVGTIIANTGGITFSSPGNATNALLLTILNGRAISLVSSVTLVNTIITVPAP